MSVGFSERMDEARDRAAERRARGERRRGNGPGSKRPRDPEAAYWQGRADEARERERSAPTREPGDDGEPSAVGFSAREETEGYGLGEWVDRTAAAELDALVLEIRSRPLTAEAPDEPPGLPIEDGPIVRVGFGVDVGAKAEAALRGLLGRGLSRETTRAERREVAPARVDVPRETPAPVGFCGETPRKAIVSDPILSDPAAFFRARCPWWK